MALEITAARPDPALLDLPWRCRSRTGRRTGWPRCPAASRGTSSGSCGCRAACWPSRRSRPTSPAASTTMLRNLERLDAVRRAVRRRQRPGRRPRASRSTRASSPGTCSSRCPTARCTARACARTRRSRLIDALAVLLVRLHLAGFWWGDVSLSNTLFRRDAGAFAAYLVDAETGELRPTPQQRPARARPRDRPGQHRRRADGPRGRRPARGGSRPRRGRRSGSSTATASCGTR